MCSLEPVADQATVATWRTAGQNPIMKIKKKKSCSPLLFVSMRKTWSGPAFWLLPFLFPQPFPLGSLQIAITRLRKMDQLPIILGK